MMSDYISCMKKKFLVIFIMFFFIAAESSAALISFDLSKNDCFNDKPGDYLRFMFHDFRIRSYRIHIPDSYNGKEPVSLMIALHGGGGRSKTMLSKTNINEKSDEKGFIAVYPNGICRLLPLRTWNVGFCCGLALEKDIDDVGFIEKLLGKLQLQFNIDPSKIFVTGHSNGGMLAYRLGSELSDIIAAIAPVAGTIGGYATEDSELWVIPEPKYPVSVLAVHGRFDESVPYEGGRGNNTGGTRSYLSVNESILFWIDYNECNPDPITNISGNITTDTYLNGNQGTEVVLCTVENGGHSWPGSKQDPYQELSATDLIWEFFENHPKQ